MRRTPQVGQDAGMLTALAQLAGTVLRGGFAILLRLRHPRPIHAHGVVLEGHLRWSGQHTRSGITWIDDAPLQEVAVVARVSRSVGLPAWLPDVIGLALRVDDDGGPADVELASTGIAVPSRFALIPHLSPARAVLTCVLPYRGASGPVLVGALPRTPGDLPADPEALAAVLRATPWRLRLCFATPSGRWHPFAELTLRTAPDQDDRELRFDAVRRMLPGADAYPWVRMLRQPSYRLTQG
ncbi:hypothetical protein ACTU3I_06975 [Microbacterium sp. RD1]|uniref:hypothetical protein n=1 Tax=Microbacterium sp. RD1 TaxID=3457313 RepID=UPI003FA5A6D1